MVDFVQPKSGEHRQTQHACRKSVAHRQPSLTVIGRHLVHRYGVVLSRRDTPLREPLRDRTPVGSESSQISVPPITKGAELNDKPDWVELREKPKWAELNEKCDWAELIEKPE